MDTMTTLERQGGDELLAQLLGELLYQLPSPTTTSGDGRRRRRGSNNKRGRRDDDRTNGAEEPAAQPRCSGRTRKTKQQKSKYLVTSEPDFDGYQWRKYGQKQIEGAMYARSYYRCTRSAEQGCPAKRTVQRNDDDGAAATKYTVVYMGEHTCTATDSLEAPVILETTAVVPAAASISTNNKRSQDYEDITINNSIAPTTSAGSCSTTCTSTGGTWIESPAISDITWSSSDHVDDYSGLLPVYDSWALAPASAASLQEMEDFTGPIRSPVHIPADGWTIDQFLMQVDGCLPFLIS